MYQKTRLENQSDLMFSARVIFQKTELSITAAVRTILVLV
jgi:hypothetical protein